MEAARERFEEVFEKHLPEVRRLVARRIGHPDDAQDLVQEVFIRAYDAYHSFTPGTNVGAWLYRIAINVCANAAKANQRYRKYVTEEPQDWNVAGHVCDAADTLVQSYEHCHLRQAVQSLSSDQILVLTLRFSDGLTLPEIAQVLGIPVDTVKSRLKSALARLQSAYSYTSLRLPNADQPHSIEVVQACDLDHLIISGEKGGKLYHSLGLLYLRKGLISAALQEWSRAQQAAPDFLDAYLDSAQQYIALDQPAKAVDTLETAVSNIRNADLHIRLAGLYLEKLGDFSECIQHSKQAIEVEPGNPEAYYVAGTAYYRKAGHEERVSWSAPDKESALDAFRASLKESASHLEEALKISEVFPRAAALLAYVHMDEHKMEQAVSEITRVIECSDSDGVILRQASWIYSKAGDFAKAEECIRKSIAIETSPHKLGALAWILQHSNKIDEAYQTYEESYRLAKSKYTKALSAANMASLDVSAGNYDLAIEHAEAAIRFNPNHSHGYCNLAQAHLMKGDSPHLIVNLCIEGLRAHRDHVCFHRMLAEAYYRLEQYDQALEEAGVAIELEPQHAERWLLRAKILMKLGQYDEARQDVMTALDLEPGNADAKARLTEIEDSDIQESQ